MLKKEKKIGGPYDKKIKEKKHSIQLETSNGNQKEKPRTKKKHFRFVREPQNQKKIEKRTFGRDWQFLEKFLEHENSKTIPVDADCWRPSARLNLATRRTRRSEEIINNRNDLFLFNFFWPDTTKKTKIEKKRNRDIPHGHDVHSGVLERINLMSLKVDWFCSPLYGRGPSIKLGKGNCSNIR